MMMFVLLMFNDWLAFCRIMKYGYRTNDSPNEQYRYNSPPPTPPAQTWYKSRVVYQENLC